MSLVRFMNDHTGNFATAIDGVNTPEMQQADNDYAVGLLVEKISKSKYANNTLIFVIEDDAQDGPDHVDSHRSIAFVAGAYVKQGALVSSSYNTVNFLRTIEEVLGLPPMNLNDALARPMTDIFQQQAQRVELYRRSRAGPLQYGPAAAAKSDRPGRARSCAQRSLLGQGHCRGRFHLRRQNGFRQSTTASCGRV